VGPAEQFVSAKRVREGRANPGGRLDQVAGEPACELNQFDPYRYATDTERRRSTPLRV